MLMQVQIISLDAQKRVCINSNPCKLQKTKMKNNQGIKKGTGDEFIDAQNWSLEVGLTSSLGASILKTQKFSRLFPPKCVTFTLGQAPHVNKYDKCHSIPSGGFHGLRRHFSSMSPSGSLHASHWPEMDHVPTLQPSSTLRLTGQSQLEPSPGVKNGSYLLSHMEDNAAQRWFPHRKILGLLVEVKGYQC